MRITFRPSNVKVSIAVIAFFLSLSHSWGDEQKCDYDLNSYLFLSMNEFDQDANGGWRALSNKGCFDEAADLIVLYKRKNDLKADTLLLHEAQMRGFAGDYASASPLMFAIKKSIANSKDYFGYSFYVDATLAFFLRDREKLVIARQALESHPKPEGYVLTDHLGNVVERPWPPNLNIVKRLEACFDMTYAEAYGRKAEGVDHTRCSEAMKRISKK